MNNEILDEILRKLDEIGVDKEIRAEEFVKLLSTQINLDYIRHLEWKEYIMTTSVVNPSAGPENMYWKLCITRKGSTFIQTGGFASMPI